LSRSRSVCSYALFFASAASARACAVSASVRSAASFCAAGHDRVRIVSACTTSLILSMAERTMRGHAVRDGGDQEAPVAVTEHYRGARRRAAHAVRLLISAISPRAAVHRAHYHGEDQGGTTHTLYPRAIVTRAAETRGAAHRGGHRARARRGRRGEEQGVRADAPRARQRYHLAQPQDRRARAGARSLGEKA
jgi:hypothetical protein